MKLAVITGGTKGIGKAIVQKLASEGFAIATCARSRQDLDALQKYIQNTYKVSCYASVADLANSQAVKEFGAFVLSHQLPIEILVNNAGIYQTGKLLEEPETNFEQMWQVNVASIYHLTRLLAPAMVARMQGHIFNICSIASQTAFENNGSYCTTKFAVYGFTKVLRQELKKDGVKVSAILPGATFTDSWAGSDISPERLVSPQDVANALYAAYLLSPQALVEEMTIRPPLGDL
jgi:short-subunit dehydrogenase